jgi:SAM-dependent methyltransferase
MTQVECEGARPPKPTNSWWNLHYLARAYDRSASIAINSLKSGSAIRLLKTDLWDEGVEPVEKNILGKIQSNNNLSLYGVDISKTVCSLAKPKVARVQITQATIENLPFRKESFDVVLDLSTLDHVPETKAMQVIGGYERVLKRGGVLVLIFEYDNIHRHTKRKQTTYYFSKILTEKIQKTFYEREEYTIGTLLSFRTLINKLPIRLRNLLLDVVLTLEYSTFSKHILKPIGTFSVTIGKKT